MVRTAAIVQNSDPAAAAAENPRSTLRDLVLAPIDRGDPVSAEVAALVVRRE